jgi:hypothetical protein
MPAHSADGLAIRALPARAADINEDLTLSASKGEVRDRRTGFAISVSRPAEGATSASRR